MLDQLAVHVDDVECSVRTGCQVDRTERRVGRGQELPTSLGPPGDEGHAGRFEHAAVNQVCQWLANERVAVVAAGNKSLARSTGPQLALKYATDSRLNRACAGLIQKIRPPSARSRIDATDDVSARYGFRSRLCCSSTTCRIGIVFQDGNRFPQSSCARPNWLKPAMASTRGRLEAPGPRRQAKPQDRAGRSRRLWPGGSARRTHLAVATAVGRIDPVVQTPIESVDPKLRVPLAEAGQHDMLFRRRDRRHSDRVKNQIFGAAVTRTPPKQGSTPFGNGNPSAKTVACS